MGSDVEAAGELFLQTVGRLDDEQVRAASALPGWTRGHVIAHVALSQFGSCATMKGDAAGPHKDDKEEAALTKAQLVALLKESTAYCDPVLTALKDEDMTALVKAGNNQAAKGLFLAGTNTHGNEMYGTMAVYLRLKGIVPPTTERQNAAKKSQ